MIIPTLVGVRGYSPPPEIKADTVRLLEKIHQSAVFFSYTAGILTEVFCSLSCRAQVLPSGQLTGHDVPSAVTEELRTWHQPARSIVIPRALLHCETGDILPCQTQVSQ